MKTLKVICILLLSGIISSNIIAQPPVIKIVDVQPACLYLECTGDQLTGNVVIDIFFMPHNWSIFVRDCKLIGYPSGKEYDCSETSPGFVNWEDNIQIRCEGKLVAVLHRIYHITTNANGEITVEFLKTNLKCM